jgi:hypothetical protein
VPTHPLTLSAEPASVKLYFLLHFLRLRSAVEASLCVISVRQPLAVKLRHLLSSPPPALGPSKPGLTFVQTLPPCLWCCSSAWLSSMKSLSSFPLLGKAATLLLLRSAESGEEGRQLGGRGEGDAEA